MKMEEAKDLYDFLQVPPRADTNEIREAYLKQAREVHPDKGGAAEAMSELGRVYAVLSDTGRRKVYDGQLQVSDKFPKLCGLCDGKGRRRYGISGWKPCPKCKATGRA